MKYRSSRTRIFHSYMIAGFWLRLAWQFATKRPHALSFAAMILAGLSAGPDNQGGQAAPNSIDGRKDFSFFFP